MNAIETYYKSAGAEDPIRAAIDYWKIFNTMMEGAAMMIDLVGPIEYTFITDSGNKIHAVLDSP